MKKNVFIIIWCICSLCCYSQTEDTRVGSKKFYEWLEKQKCTQICGAKFGSSYEIVSNSVTADK